MYLLIKLMSFIQLQAGTIFFQWASWRLENADYFGILGSDDARYYTPNTGQLMVIFADTFFQTDINLVWGHDKRATIKLRTIVLLGGASRREIYRLRYFLNVNTMRVTNKHENTSKL